MCKKNEVFIGNIVSWDDKTILMSDMGIETRAIVYDASGLRKLLGRKRKHVWLRVEDATLRHVSWVSGGRGGVELHCSRDTNKWYRRV